jgi:hypothetical protein
MQKGRLIGVTLLFAGLVSRFAFGVGVVSARETDRLSTAAFSEPPLHVRPGSFWDWLKGGFTSARGHALHPHQS